MEITVKIENCQECRYKDHSGAFTPGGARMICGHEDTCKNRGYGWQYRIIKDWPKIPGWCPLRNGAKY